MRLLTVRARSSRCEPRDFPLLTISGQPHQSQLPLLERPVMPVLEGMLVRFDTVLQKKQKPLSILLSFTTRVTSKVHPAQRPTAVDPLSSCPSLPCFLPLCIPLTNPSRLSPCRVTVTLRTTVSRPNRSCLLVLPSVLRLLDRLPERAVTVLLISFLAPFGQLLHTVSLFLVQKTDVHRRAYDKDGEDDDDVDARPLSTSTSSVFLVVPTIHVVILPLAPTRSAPALPRFHCQPPHGPQLL